MKAIVEYTKNTLGYFVMLFVWLTAALFLSIFLLGFISMLLAAAGVSRFLLLVFRSIAVTTLCSLFIFKYTYSRIYKEARFNIKEVLISLLLLCTMQFILAYILRFAEYTTGGAYYLARLLYRGTVYFDSDVPDIYNIISLAIVEPFYISGGIAGAYFGERIRLRDRSRIFDSANNDKNGDGV